MRSSRSPTATWRASSSQDRRAVEAERAKALGREREVEWPRTRGTPCPDRIRGPQLFEPAAADSGLPAAWSSAESLLDELELSELLLPSHALSF